MGQLIDRADLGSFFVDSSERALRRWAPVSWPVENDPPERARYARRCEQDDQRTRKPSGCVNLRFIFPKFIIERTTVTHVIRGSGKMRPPAVSVAGLQSCAGLVMNRPRAQAKRPSEPPVRLPHTQVPEAMQRADAHMRGLVFANRQTDPNRSPDKLFADLQEGFENFKAHHNQVLNNIQSSVDNIYHDLATKTLNGHSGGGIDAGPPPDPEYSKAFASWFRSGDPESQTALHAANRTGSRQQIQAAMSGGSASDGGYLAPIEWDRQVNKALRSLSPMRRIARVVQTEVRGFQTIWNPGGFGSGWVGETASRPATSTPSLSPLTFLAGELYAMPATTQNLIDDAEVNIEQWLASELQEEFAYQEGPAFITGDGVNKPQGLLTFATGGTATHPGGAVSVFASGVAADINPDALVDLVYQLRAPYRQNGRWLMNSLTAAKISKLKDSVGQYLWQPSLIIGQPPTLLGYPVEIDENMPAVAAGNLAIAFGDFTRAYLVNDRGPIRILRDPFSNKPFVLFYTTKRVGGGVLDPKAVVFMKIAAS